MDGGKTGNPVDVLRRAVKAGERLGKAFVTFPDVGESGR